MWQITYETFILAFIGSCINAIDMIFTIILIGRMKEEFSNAEDIEINFWSKLFKRGWKYKCLFLSF